MLVSIYLVSLLSVSTMGAQNPRQAAAQQLSFEVASVKKSTIDRDSTSVDDLRTVGVQFLPGGRFYAKAPLAVLLLEAFKGRVIQAGSGPNQWDRALERDYWEIQAVSRFRSSNRDDRRLPWAGGRHAGPGCRTIELRRSRRH
jgi:hypothetical protein